MNTVKSLTSSRELLSALADGEVDSAELASAIQGCRQDESSLACWNSYQLIGSVLRTPALPVHAVDAAFLGRLNQNLALEPAHQVCTAAAGLDESPAQRPVDNAPRQQKILQHAEASNDAAFRWKLVAGFASLAAVGAMAWNAMGVFPNAGAPQLAQSASPAPSVQQIVVASPQGPIVRDTRLEELLAAHRQLGGASALQAPSGFLQNAAFETPLGAKR